MIHIRLSDEDRERLGGDSCPEWLSVDPYSVTIVEAWILQDGFTMGGKKVAYNHPGEWREALHPKGSNVPQFPALLVLVWLGLRRAGITTALDGLDLSADHLAYRVDPVASEDDDTAGDADASPGKDDVPPTSPSGDEPAPAPEL